MSVTYEAITLIGCAVTRDKIYRISKVQLCGNPNVASMGCTLHKSSLDYSQFSVCPFCASHIWSEIETRIDNEQGYINVKLPAMDVKINIINRAYDNKGSLWFVGHIFGKIHDDNKHVFTQYENIIMDKWRLILEESLKDIELWDERSFGLYTILTAG